MGIDSVLQDPGNGYTIIYGLRCDVVRRRRMLLEHLGYRGYINNQAWRLFEWQEEWNIPRFKV